MRQILLAALALLCAAPMALAQSAGYRIQPGDVLAITVLEDETLNRELLVLPDGRISVPLAGSISASGQTVEAVERVIADRLASNFAVRPSVFVSVVTVDEEEETFPIYVLGQVDEPGPGRGASSAPRSCRRSRSPAASTTSPRPSASSCADATPRPGRSSSIVFNYNAVERGAAIQSMITLREGDVILVPERRLFE